MAVLMIIISTSVLVLCVVLLAQRLSRPARPQRAAAGGEGADVSWLPAAVADGGSDCAAADGGAGCDGGGGGGGD